MKTPHLKRELLKEIDHCQEEEAKWLRKGIEARTLYKKLFKEEI